MYGGLMILGATRMVDPDGLGSCASSSDSQISLSYSMAVFSTNSFGLFSYITNVKTDFLIMQKTYWLIGW